MGQRLAASLDADFFACKGRLAEVVNRVWREYGEIVCIMATGIVVRTIAPLLQDKYRDPAIVVCDEQGRFAVSLLSGHLGGANDLAAPGGRRDRRTGRAHHRLRCPRPHGPGPLVPGLGFDAQRQGHFHQGYGATGGSRLTDPVEPVSPPGPAA